MDILLMMYIGLAIIGLVLSILTIFAKNDTHTNIIVTISCIFVAFIGFTNFSSLPSNYTLQRIFALIATFLVLIPFFLNLFKNKIRHMEKEKIQRAIQASIFLTIFANIALLFC